MLLKTRGVSLEKMDRSDVLVVSDCDEMELARQINHEISRKGVKSAVYANKDYLDNEKQISGTQLVIFLGENELSRGIMSRIDWKYEKCGARWGISGPKVVIAVDPLVFDESEYIKELNRLSSLYHSEYNKLASHRLARLDFWEKIWSHLEMVKEWINDEIIGSRSNQKRKQYELGVTSFIVSGLDGFLEQGD